MRHYGEDDLGPRSRKGIRVRAVVALIVRLELRGCSVSAAALVDPDGILGRGIVRVKVRGALGFSDDVGRGGVFLSDTF